MSATDREQPAAGTAEVTFRATSLADGADVCRMARASGRLDENSSYAYLMWCDLFRGASVVAEVDGEPAGFVCGVRPPETPDVLFVWQVAVASEHRGRRIAGRMIDALLDRNPDVRFVEATVTPSNEPSARLFRSIGRAHGCSCEETPYASSSDFPDPDHEPEVRFRIGPIERTS